MTEAFIFCENLVKIYKLSGLEVQALQGLDLTVGHGELLGIVGASGSGKSTLLNILGGLDRPTAGRAMVGRQNLLKMNSRALDRYRKTTVGFVWQQSARNLIPYLTARENVELPMTLAGLSGRKARARAEELLRLVELADRQEHRMSQLSGGEQQRVAIAVALANQPALLLADEPTGEVDNLTAQTIYAAFRNLNARLGVTTLIVSHDLGIAKHVDRVVAVRDGKLASETVRRRASAKGKADTHEVFQVLDSAGRFQVPKEYLDRFHIRRRVKLELREDGILVKPAMIAPEHDLIRKVEDAEADSGTLPSGMGRWLEGMVVKLSRNKERGKTK